MYGCSDDEIAAIRAGSLEGFAPQEIALLRMADAMADTPSNVDDELYAELRRHFSEEQLIELAASAALENSRAVQPRVRCGERRAVSKRAAVQAAPSRLVVVREALRMAPHPGSDMARSFSCTHLKVSVASRHDGAQFGRQTADPKQDRIEKPVRQDSRQCGRRLACFPTRYRIRDRRAVIVSHVSI